jgi:hypothetical protein
MKGKKYIVNYIDDCIVQRIKSDDFKIKIVLKPNEDMLAAFKRQEPDLYLDMFNEIFDELHPY